MKTPTVKDSYVSVGSQRPNNKNIRLAERCRFPSWHLNSNPGPNSVLR